MDDRRLADAVSPVVDLRVYDALILDFDGPMCNLFAGYPAAKIAQELKRLLVKNGWPADALPATSDPHQILRLAYTLTPVLEPTIESALTAAEISAVETATETPGLTDLLAQLRESGISVAVASNNNATAIQRWLDIHNHDIEHVVGRNPDDPSRMKPEPDVLIKAMSLLRARPDRTIFVGDAITDADAASAAACMFIAFANKPMKVERFERIGCRAIIKDLGQITQFGNKRAATCLCICESENPPTLRITDILQ